ncbi:MAG: KH domain-containing protein, partial [Brevinema sp.]
GLSRREVGHGHLAERALIPMIPDHEVFPYTIRFVSEITESNGSSSMASVCAGSLSMMASGVPLKAAVAGIAMGLVWDKESNDYTVLSDIQGLEDHHGDMDFKVAGTKNGITAIQMDLKTAGLPEDIMKIALSQAKEGRMHILGIMNETITEARSTVADSAPKLQKITIDPEHIGTVIGSGGRVIKKIMADYKTEINIEDTGEVVISGSEASKIAATIKAIRQLSEGFKEDEEITGPVTRIEPFGIFIEVLPGTQALLHTSKMKDPLFPYTLGDMVTIFFKNIDEKKRMNVYQINKDVEPPKRERRDFDKNRGDRRDRGDKKDSRKDDRKREDKPAEYKNTEQKTEVKADKSIDKGHSPDDGI